MLSAQVAVEHLVARAPYTLLNALADGPRAFLGTVTRGLVTGRLRVGGLWRAAPRLAVLLAALVGPQRDPHPG